MKGFLFALAIFSASTAEAGKTYLVILSGLGGEEGYRQRFLELALTMRDAAVTKYGLAEEDVFLLAEDPERSPELIRAKSTKENIIALFDELSEKLAPGDQLYVLLIGHGSFRSEESRFNLPGPDLTAEEFDALLEPFREQQIVFVDTTSASGGFLPVLSGSNRIVVTATKSGYERNESKFAEFFVEAYAGEEADSDKNERVSVLEAYDYARLRVDGYYDEQNILKTEHAQLDDDGDGQGVYAPGEGEGDLASASYLTGPAGMTAGLGEGASAADPELAKLLEQKNALESRVVALRAQKDSMPEDLYLQELEAVLVELAEVTERIEERQQR